MSTVVRLPYDGTEVGRVAEADVSRALAIATEGAQAMSQLTNYDRAELLLRVQGLLRRDLEEFAAIISNESGKPIREARTEAERALQTLTAAAEAARNLRGEVVPIDGAPIGKSRMAMTVREPLGIIAAITPFNFPLNLAMHKIAPALGGGNAVVHKPATATPLSALRLVRTFEEAGAPAGAYTVVAGAGSSVGRQLVADERVAMITFTGSVPIGTGIRAEAGLKRVTLEMGSNSPVIVEPDCDLDLAVERCTTGSFSNSGQVCISVQRIYVQERIASEFLDRLRAATEKLRIGHPCDENTDVSSLINEQEAIRVTRQIEQSVSAGATLVTGGERHRATVTPTILRNVSQDDGMSRTEVFGPVVAVNSYRELNEAIQAVNASDYGLQAGIFTRDLERAFHAARRIEAGGVLINDVPAFRADLMPYGGVKQSGIGREGPRYAIEEMTEMKLICWRV